MHAIGELHISGNVTPIVWHQRLRFPPDAKERAAGKPGKPHSVAIVVLSDVVYWYRPIRPRDERTGQEIGQFRKFYGERLRRAIGEYVELFGYSYDQVRDAIDYLAAEGYIVKTVDKAKGNEMYLEPVVERIRELCAPPDAGETPSGPQPRPSGLQPNGSGPQPKASGLQPIHPTEISPRTTQPSSSARAQDSSAVLTDRDDDDSTAYDRIRAPYLAAYTRLTGNDPEECDRKAAGELAESGAPLEAVEKGIRQSLKLCPNPPVRTLVYCLGAIRRAVREGKGRRAVQVTRGPVVSEPPPLPVGELPPWHEDASRA